MCQYIGITMTSLNRFTSLAFLMNPIQNKVFWLNLPQASQLYCNCYIWNQWPQWKVRPTPSRRTRNSTGNRLRYVFQMWELKKVKIYWSLIVLATVTFCSACTLFAQPSYDDVNPPRVAMNFQKNMENRQKVIALQGTFVLILVIFNMVLLFGTAGLILARSFKRQRIRTITPANLKTQGRTGRKVINWVQLISSKELGLCLFTILLSSTMSLYLFYIALILQSGDFFIDFKGIILHMYSDMISVINPFGLVLLSGTFRERMAEFVSFKSKKEKVKTIAEKFLIFVAVCYFLFIFLMVLALFDVYFSCFPFNTGYHGNFCQMLMGCREEGL